VKRVLIVEDERIAGKSLAEFLSRQGYQSECLATFSETRESINREKFDIYLVDVRLPDGNGLQLISRIRTKYGDAIIVILTAYGTMEDAITALKAGADNYLIKPINLDELIMVLQKEEERQSLQQENIDLKTYLTTVSGFDNLIGKSPAMLPVLERIKKLCLSNANVLITGESGTGKELVARTLHYSGSRREKPFVAINCAAIPDNLLESELFGHARGAFTGAVREHTGKFEYADGGTIFLDEIAELSPALQGKLLRILQEKTFEKLGSNRQIRVDVRVVASTNKDLKALVAEERFREDLYWRLNVVEVFLPPLRERVEDIELLARHFLKEYARHYKKPIPILPAEILNVFQAYSWPGNIRELENVIERAITLMENSEITLDLLPTRLRRLNSHYSDLAESGEASLKGMLKSFEEKILGQVLREEGGNRARTAERLGISLRTLQYKLARRAR